MLSCCSDERKFKMTRRTVRKRLGVLCEVKHSMCFCRFVDHICHICHRLFSPPLVQHTTYNKDNTWVVWKLKQSLQLFEFLYSFNTLNLHL